MARVATLTFVLLLQAACAHLTAEQTARICPVLAALHGDGDRRSSDQWGVLDSMSWELLPSQACGARQRGYRAVGFSPDGAYAGVESGWQAAPLAGEGGRCLLTLEGSAWRLSSCEVEWVS